MGFSPPPPFPAPPPPLLPMPSRGVAFLTPPSLQMATLDVLDVLLQSQERDGTVPDMPNSVLELSTRNVIPVHVRGLIRCHEGAQKTRDLFRGPMLCSRCAPRATVTLWSSAPLLPKKRLGAVTAAVARRGTKVRRRRHPRPLNARACEHASAAIAAFKRAESGSRKRCPWES